MRRCILLCLLCGTLLFAQHPLKQMEQQRQTLLRQQITLSLEIGVLKKQLSPLQTAIDSLQKTHAKLSEINALQKRALSISKQIVALQSKADSLNQEIKTLNGRLFTIYTHQMDSLRQQLSTVRTAKKKKALLKKLNRLSERCLRVSPELQNLPFDLQKLAKLRVNEVKDSVRKAILIDYLRRALQAIDTQSHYLQLKKDELTRMQRLRRKTLAFMDEINDAPMRTPFSTKENRSRGTQPQESYSIQPSTRSTPSVVPDLTQIDRLIQQSLEMQSRVPADSVLKAITQTQNILREYRRIIKAKLKK